MADIPGFLNRIDFYGVLLPGYIGVILSLVLFFPDLLARVGEQKMISADIFSAVVFLIAGPAVGYTVRSFHRYVYTIMGVLTRNQRRKRQRNNYLYAEIRAKSSKDDREEIDQAESLYDFNISTAVVLILIGFYYLYSKGPDLVLLPIFVLAAILLFGGAVERVETFGPIVNKLREKANIPIPR